MTGGYTMKEKNIQELAIRMGLISVEDMCQYTIAQLVVKIANKVNELVGEVWRFETDVQEILKTQNENIQYLLGEGLHLEVENIFDGWLQDGTFDTLLNQSALKKVNDRIDETNAQLSNIKYYVTPEMFGAKGDGITDDTEAIQRAIDSLTNDGGSVIFSPKAYMVKGTLLINRHGITLKGSRATRNLFGTRIISDNSSSEPVLKITQGSAMLVGGCLENIAFLGNNQRQEYSSALNKIGIYIENVAELNMTNVFVSGFKNGGIYAEDWWDSTITGLEIRACGIPATDDLGATGIPALWLTSGDNSCNSLHFFGLHIEECPYQLKLDRLTSHCHFVGCKFEDGSQSRIATKYLIFIYEGAYSNTFTSCFFAMGGTTIIPQINVRNNKTIFNSCNFSAGGELGIKPIIHSSKNASFGKGLIINGCSFDGLTYVENPIELNHHCVFSNNVLLFKENNGEIKPILINGNSNTISSNTLINDNYTNGHVFDVRGQRNKFKGNAYSSSKKVFSFTNSFNEFDAEINMFVSATSANDINLDFTTSKPKNFFWNFGTTTTMTKNNLLNPYNGATFKIIANQGTLILDASMLQNSATNVQIPSGGVIELIYSTTVNNWYIKSKSF